MPQRQLHRGQHPEDAKLFDAKQLPVLCRAVTDLSFLLSRGYAEKAAQKLVGDHYQLDVRQRRAVLGASCTENSIARRRAHEASAAALAGCNLHVDGYNILIVIECALSEGVLLRGRDGCVRDLASIHGSYHAVEETLPAVRLLGNAIANLHVAHTRWFFDAPVSNSGRLRALFLGEAEARGWPWSVELTSNPDRDLAVSRDIVATSDSWILDRAEHWFNLAAAAFTLLSPRPRVLDLTRDVTGWAYGGQGTDLELDSPSWRASTEMGKGVQPGGEDCVAGGP